MSTVTFTGASLALASVSQQSLVTLRVTYTQDALAGSSLGAHDALNPTLYSLSGPGSALITGVAAVAGDPESFDVFLAAPLAAGTWTLTVSSALQDTGGNSVGPPTSLQLTVVGSSKPESVSKGATNDDAEEILRRFFNPALNGRAWDALIKVVAKEEQANYDLAKLAYKQKFKYTASGIYLTRKASDDGTERPLNVGMSDDVFRKFAIAVVNNQLTEEALLEVLEVFYGSDAVRALVSTDLAEPFALQDGDDLQILVDEKVSVNTVFAAADFAQIGVALAIEVAAALTRSFEYNGTLAWALPVVDNTTGLTKVRVFSPSKGLSSSIRVTGGKAQNALQFSSLLPLLNGSLPTWTITVLPITGIMRFTTTGVTGLDMSGLRIGDYVNIFGGEFQAVNRGSFPVLTVSVTYPSGVLTQSFDVANPAAVAQTSLAQATAASVMYFRPIRKTIYTVQNRAVTVTVPAGRVDINVPATSSAVNRQAKSAAYGQVAPTVAVSTLTRQAGVVTVAATSHGMAVGDSFILDGAVAGIATPGITAGDATHTAYSLGSVWSSFASPGSSRYFAPIVQLLDGRVLVIGGRIPGGATSSTVDRFTITGTTVFPTGTRYTITNLADNVADANRMMASAVLIDDPAAAGKVLLLGGTNNSGTYASTSLLYTPGSIGSSGTWGSSATMIDAFAARFAIVRTDHKIMAIGGGAAGAASTHVETYTASTNAWAAAGALNIARSQTHAVQLNDGTILVGGGRVAWTTLDHVTLADLGTLTNTAEVYTVGSNTWARVGSMTYARVGHRMFKLPDGRVIAIGGAGYNPSQGTTVAYLNTTEIYDPTLKIWGPGPSMRMARGFFAVTQIGNRIYCAGGSATDTSIEFLDIASMTFCFSPAALGAPAVKTNGLNMSGLMFMTYGLNGAAGTNLNLLTPGTDTFSSGDLNGIRRVASVVNANTFTFNTPRTAGYTAAAGGTITPFKARKAKAGVPGPYTFDPAGGVAVTSTKTTSNQIITAGHQYGSLDVADASQFPDEPGYICLAFGYQNQTAPVPYLGRLSPTALIIDYSFVFPQSLASGVSVTLLSGKGAFIPKTPEQDGAFYLTDSPAGRIAAIGTISDIAGGGLTVNENVAYPGDRGLGGEGRPTRGATKLSDVVEVFGSSSPDIDEANARLS